MLKFTLSNGSGAGTMASNASSSDAESLTSGQVNRLRQNWAVHEGMYICKLLEMTAFILFLVKIFHYLLNGSKFKKKLDL